MSTKRKKTTSKSSAKKTVKKVAVKQKAATAPKRASRNKVAKPLKTAKKAPRALTAKPAKAPARAAAASKTTKTTKKAPAKKAQPSSSGSSAYPGMREALLRLRERMTGQIDFLTTDNLNRKQDDAETDFRSEEQGTDNYVRDFALTRVSSGQKILFEIDEALNRLMMGTYGLCESCGCAIEKARMKALPYSRMCVACQSRSEANNKYMRPTNPSAFSNIVDANQSEPGSEDE